MAFVRATRMGVALLTALLALALVPADLWAQKVQRIVVRVRVIHAGDQPGQVDPALEDLKGKLGPIKFGSLRMLEKRNMKLRFGERGEVKLPTGSALRIQLISIHGKLLHMHVELPPEVDGRLQKRSGERLILGGQRHENGHLFVEIVPDF
jgi:hypothetical protein